MTNTQPQLPTVTGEDVQLRTMLEAIASIIKDAVQFTREETKLALARTTCTYLRDIPMDLGTFCIRDRPDLNLFGMQRSNSYYKFECRAVMLRLRE